MLSQTMRTTQLLFSQFCDTCTIVIFFLMIRRPPRSTPLYSSAASDVYKRQEGGKAFETLVKTGIDIQRKTQETAEAKLNEATQKMSGIATELNQKATGQWDKLETIFEDRVAKALHKMGVPSAEQLQDLLSRIEALENELQKAKKTTRTTKVSKNTKAPLK